MKPIQKSLFLTMPKDIKLQGLLPRMEQQKAQSFITLSLTLLAVIIFGFFAISPTLSTISELNKQLDDNHFVDDRLVEKISDLSKLQEQYAQLESDFSYVYSAIPKETEIPQFIAQIQSIASDSKVTLLRVQTLPVAIGAQTTKYTALTVGIDIAGQQQDVYNFFNELSSFQRVITIDNITLTKTSPSNVLDFSIRANIKGKIYFQRG